VNVSLHKKKVLKHFLKCTVWTFWKKHVYN